MRKSGRKVFGAILQSPHAGVQQQQCIVVYSSNVVTDVREYDTRRPTAVAPRITLPEYSLVLKKKEGQVYTASPLLLSAYDTYHT